MAIIEPHQHNTIQRSGDDGFKAARHKFVWQVHDACVCEGTKAELLSLVDKVSKCELATHHIVSARRVARCHERDAYRNGVDHLELWDSWESLDTAVLFDAFADAFEPYTRRITPDVA